MKSLLSMVMLALILAAIHPCQGQKVCEVNCFDTVPNCQVGNKNCLFPFLFFLNIKKKKFWCATFGYLYFQFFFNVIAINAYIHPEYGAGV
jgi:hypothetical protein